MKSTFLAICALFFLTYPFAYGQWQHIGGFGSNDLSFVEIDEATGICLAGGTTIYKSTNGGVTWTSAGSIGSQPLEAVVVNPTTYVAIRGTGVGFLYRTTNCFDLGLAESNGMRWVLSPNPASQHIRIAASQPAEATVTVLDVNGRPVLHGKTDAYGEAEIDVSHLAPGYYSVRMHSSVSGDFVLPFVKE